MLGQQVHIALHRMRRVPPGKLLQDRQRGACPCVPGGPFVAQIVEPEAGQADVLVGCVPVRCAQVHAGPYWTCTGL